MFSFPTHLLVGAALSYLLGFSMLFGAIGGMLTDLDYFTPWHRGPYHSLAIALVAAAIVHALTRSRKKSIGLGIGFAAHTIADWINYLGVMIFWPFSTTYYHLDLVTWDDPYANIGLSLASILTIIIVKKRREGLGWAETVKSFWPLNKHINNKKKKVK